MSTTTEDVLHELAIYRLFIFIEDKTKYLVVTDTNMYSIMRGENIKTWILTYLDEGGLITDCYNSIYQFVKVLSKRGKMLRNLQAIISSNFYEVLDVDFFSADIPRYLKRSNLGTGLDRINNRKTKWSR